MQQMVYVISHTGRPIAPTMRHGHVRELLDSGRARVVRMEPFTIQLLYENTEYHQECTLGIDAGSQTVGLSVTTEHSELICAEVELRGDDIVKNLSNRREARNNRRYRKCRYRKARFDNRKRPAGWLPPSVRAKADAHLRIVKTITEILPISRINIEIGQFDLQLIQNPSISGAQYQQGPQLGFWNVREYVLCRDGHKCVHCNGKSKDHVLNVHHLESRKTGGNSPDNLVTLCKTCHEAYHRGEIKLKTGRKKKSLRDATFMNVTRMAVYDKLKVLYPNVHLTYGYVTKYTRISHGIEKTHCADAFCIAGNLKAERLPYYYSGICVPRHSRSLHVQNMKKGGVRRSAVAPHWIKGTRLQRYDYVWWNGTKCFIAGSTGGRPVLRDIGWNLVTKTASVNAKAVKFLARKRGSILYQLIKKK